MQLRSLLKEPLLHFLLLGGLLFALYGWVNSNGNQAPTDIVIDQARLSALQTQFTQVWQRPPTAQESRALIDSWVKEEVLYREGIARGLDRDDPLVRRRVGQKMEYLGDGQVPEKPSDSELQAWLDSHASDYQIPARYSFRQVYFDPNLQGEQLQSTMLQALAALNQGSDAEFGNTSMLPAQLTDVSDFEVNRLFGSDFSTSLDALPIDQWQGPIRSGFGLHLLRISARELARTAPLDVVRNEVERDLISARAGEAKEAFYQNLLQRYSVRLELDDSSAPPALTSTR